MSLVESALKKLQQTRASQARAQRTRDHVALGVAPRAALDAALRGPLPTASRRIVQLDLAALRVAGLVPPEREQRQLEAECRSIKRNLLAHVTGRGATKVAQGNRIIVTSALPREGKTFLTLNLALSMALESDTSVLVIDGDVLKPHITRAFGLSADAGLLDVLGDESRDVESVIFQTNVSRFSIIPAGQPAATSAELLASVRMEEILASIRVRRPNCVILFDSPPLMTGESVALASMAGQIVLVVRADATPHQAVQDALAVVREHQRVGLVLNQTLEGPKGGSYYAQDRDRSELASVATHADTA